MKKAYSKPSIEIEVYELSASIASNCGDTVSLGPEAPGYEICDEFKDAFDVVTTYGLLRTEKRTPFYSDGAANCDCYYSSGGAGYFTS